MDADHALALMYAAQHMRAIAASQARAASPPTRHADASPTANGPTNNTSVLFKMHAGTHASLRHQADLNEAEALLRRALASANSEGSPYRQRRKEMREQLVLFLLQEGRDGCAAALHPALPLSSHDNLSIVAVILSLLGPLTV